jgi:hypothetical protein
MSKYFIFNMFYLSNTGKCIIKMYILLYDKSHKLNIGFDYFIGIHDLSFYIVLGFALDYSYIYSNFVLR